MQRRVGGSGVGGGADDGGVVIIAGQVSDKRRAGHLAVHQVLRGT